jgi:hypothetical protein
MEKTLRNMDWGFEMGYSVSGIRKKPFSYPGVKKAPVPGSDP